MAEDNTNEILTFRDLKKEVHLKGLCGKCGGCVSFCSAGDLNALRIGQNGLPEFVDEEKCVECGICYLICPETNVLNTDLVEKFSWKAPIGRWRNLTSARTTDQKLHARATDGGVVTSLLLYALKKGIINGALVSKRTGPFSRQPIIATTPEEIKESAGTFFEESSHLEEVGDIYTTYSPTIYEIKVLEKSTLERLAIVGTPCQINTIRKMQVLGVLPSNSFTLTIGLFCVENFSFDQQARKKLEKTLKVNLDKVKKLNIKDDVIITKDTGEKIHIPIDVVDQVARPACLACSHFANDFADIACGGLGSPDGYTTTVVRTEFGETVYNGAKLNGFLDELSFKTKKEQKIHKSKLLAKITSFNKMKKKRSKMVTQVA